VHAMQHSLDRIVSLFKPRTRAHHSSCSPPPSCALLLELVQVWYCSVVCQKTHWKGGGHKKVCKAASAVAGAGSGATTAIPRGSTGSAPRPPTASSAPAKKRTAAAFPAVASFIAAGGSDDGRACIICLESDPPPIQSGCACRGDAGLAHVECRILAAEHKQKSSGGLGGWQVCSTCGQLFEGAMALGLAEKLLLRVQGQPEFVNEWCFAALILSTALTNAGRHAEAEAVCRETMAALDRMGVNAPKISMTQLRTKLGNALNNQGKVAEAHVIFERCFAEYTELLGPDDMLTLDCARSLAHNLSRQGKHTEAVAILQDIARRSSRASGPENTATLDFMYRLAIALLAQGKHDEALAMYVEIMPVMKRVLGPDHVRVLQGLVSYAIALASCGRLVEAEAMLVETLPVMTRVLGAEHPSTRRTVERIAMVRELMNARN
jgi:hypothetical protein